MEERVINQIVSAVTSRICHDLINPIGSAQLAADHVKMGIGSNDLLDNCIKQAIARLDMFRKILHHSENDTKMAALKEHIEKEKLNIKLDEKFDNAILLFFLIQKMLGKSSIKIENNKIILEKMFLTEGEIEMLTAKKLDEQTITTGNILPYIARINTKGTITIEKRGENWEITIN